MLAFCDGACRVSNPGICASAWAIYSDDGHLGPDETYYHGPELHSNNFSEYMGLLGLLQYADKNALNDLVIYCDSKLVVEQVNCRWRVNEKSLYNFQVLATALLIRGGHTLRHMRGHAKDSGHPYNYGNKHVDWLCNQRLDKEMGIEKTR